MSKYNRRRSTPRVKNGRTQSKNNHTKTRQAGLTYTPMIGKGWELDFAVDYPGPGFRHVVERDDIDRFSRLVPHFAEYMRGLRGLTLAAGNDRTWGVYYTGSKWIELNAWERDRTVYFSEHDKDNNPQDAFFIDILNLPRIKDEDGVYYEDSLEENVAKAYVLLDVLLHEIGHHVDCMSTHKRRTCPGKEPFANTFAFELQQQIWRRVFREFRI